MIGTAFLVVTILSVMAAGGVSALQTGFYATSCPNAEDTIYSTLQQLHANDADLPPVLLRLHFHDCFVRVSTPHALNSIQSRRLLLRVALKVHEFCRERHSHHRVAYH